MTGNERHDGKRCATWTLLVASAIAPFAIANALGAETDATAKEQRDAKSEASFATIVVTAQRREESMQKVPISVTALSADDLVSRSVFAFEDIAKSVPGLAISAASTTAPSAALPVVYIRGIGQQDPSIYTDPGVGIYVDGVYVARSAGASIALPDLQRIEVLRGPQGTLFGKNAVGGAVNMVTQPPSAIPTAKLDLTLGNYNLANMRGVASGPLADTIRGSIAFDFRKEDGYQNRLSYPSRQVVGRQGDQDHQAARGMLHIEPNNSLAIDLSADYTKHRDTTAPSRTVVYPPTGLYNLWNSLVGTPSGIPWTSANTHTGDNYSTFATGPNFANNDIWGVSASVKWKMPWATFKSITAYRDVKEDYSRDADGSPASYFSATGFHELQQTSQEFQLLGSALDSRLEWLAGFYYMREAGGQQDLALILPGLYTATKLPARELGRNYNVTASTDSYAGYGQATYHLSDKLAATLGFRYTSERKSALVWATGPDSGILYVPPTNMGQTFSSPTPKLGLQYQLDRDTMFYASATEGFKSGGFNGRAARPEVLSTFSPETVLSYEAGVKSVLLDKKLRLNLAAYSSRYKNMQLYYTKLTPAGTLNIVSNVASAELQGAEIEAAIAPIKGLEIGAAVAYNDNNYKEIQPGSEVTMGNKLPYSPRTTVSASVQYRFKLAGGGQLTPRFDYSHRSLAYSTVNNSAPGILPAYALLNGRITYVPANGSWRLSAYGTNLADKFYLVSAADSTSASNQFSLIGRPRELGLTLSFEY